MTTIKIPFRSAKYDQWLEVETGPLWARTSNIHCYNIHRLLKGGSSKLFIIWFNDLYGHANSFRTHSNGNTIREISVDKNGNHQFERRNIY